MNGRSSVRHLPRQGSTVQEYQRPRGEIAHRTTVLFMHYKYFSLSSHVWLLTETVKVERQSYGKAEEIKQGTTD
jgi:hypothetical protein